VALFRKAQFSILASKLIAVYACLAKAVEVAFFHLFSANDMRNELSKAGITKRGSVIFGPPRNDGVFFPLFATLDAFYAQFFVVVLHVNLNMLQPMSRDDSVLRDLRIPGVSIRADCCLRFAGGKGIHGAIGLLSQAQRLFKLSHNGLS
jgi:hypothetical protein